MSERPTSIGTEGPVFTALRVWRDDGGAILLLGVFLGVFLAALLYYVVGIAEAIHTREGLQDAADASAFAAAILHARGMNVIAFVNVVMAALVAVLVACRVVQGLCWVGIGLAVGLAHPTFGASLAAVPPLQATHAKFEAAYRGLQGPVMSTLRVLHATQRMIARAVPPAAAVDSVIEVNRHHPPARFGVALPGGARLPVEPDRFDVLCARAGETVAGLALWPLDRAGLGPVAGPLRSAAGALTSSAASFFCGAGGSSAPVYERRERVSLPRSSAAQECEQEARRTDGPVAVCELARRELEAAQPGPDGHCRPAQDCSPRGAYARLAREARRQCHPRPGVAPSSFWFQRQTVEIEYTFRTRSGWVPTRVSRRAPRLVEEAFAPCGPHGSVGTDWNLEAFPVGQGGRVEPLCAEDHKAPTEVGEEGQRVVVEHEEVTHLFGCEIFETRREEPFDGVEPLEGGRAREPHRVAEGVSLGGERLQIRAVAISGELSPTEGVIGARDAEAGVAAATWGAGAPRRDRAAWGVLFGGAATLLGRSALAQAEFYYDHDGREARSEWLWNMKWTARLVRFRGRGAHPSPESDGADVDRLTSADVSGFGALCRATGSVPGCELLDDTVLAWEGLLLH